MILKELCDLYGRLLDSGAFIAPPGFSVQKISYRVVLRADGELVRIEDAREVEIITKRSKNGTAEKKVLKSCEMLVLGGTKSSGSGVNPCFLWDNVTYMLGVAELDKKQNNKKRIAECFHIFRKKHLDMEQEINSPEYSAVCRFLENWNPELFSAYNKNPDIFKGFGVFMLEGAFRYVHENPQIIEWWQSTGSRKWRSKGEDNAPATQGICLITGKKGPIARIHEPDIKGVFNAMSKGAKLVAFNMPASESYGKVQSENSPVCEYAAFAYCNALNYLLSKDTCRARIGDATVVFWTDAPEKDEADEMELLIAGGLDPGKIGAIDSEVSARVALKLKDIAQGKKVLDDLTSSVRFFILGLSSNVSRLSVRFFYTGTIGEFVQNLQSHYAALELQPRGAKFDDPAIISPYMILRETAREGSDAPPLFGGALMRSILQKLPYPDAIAMAILRRYRLPQNNDNRDKESKDKNKKKYISNDYICCAFLKAWLTRKRKNYNLKTMLDNHNTQTGYLLGRLFAILCYTQKCSSNKLNRTLRDSFYSSASSTPLSVFPRILKLYNHHISKLGDKNRDYLDNLVREVMCHLSTLPAHLNLEQQGLFALGFYHQTQVFYTSSTQEN